jgi:hypothetical protein
LDAVVVRSLTREYLIRTSSAELAQLVAFIDAQPEMAGARLIRVEIVAEPACEGFTLKLPTGEATAQSVFDAANQIHAAIFGGIQEEAIGAPLVHGASLVCNGHRLIVVGHKGSGKSTLALHLLARGFEVEGDEHVVLREHDVVARPRRMRVKPGSLPLVPGFAAAVLRSPTVYDPITAGPIYAVDPSISGRPWRIAPGKADHLVFIEPNHGGRSELRASSRNETFGWLAEHCLLPNVEAAAASARIHRLALATPSWRLSLGDLEEGYAALAACVS